MSLKEARPRERLECSDREDSLSLDLEVSFGASKTPGLNLDSASFELLLRRKVKDHEDLNVLGVGESVADMMMSDMGGRKRVFPTLVRSW